MAWLLAQITAGVSETLAPPSWGEAWERFDRTAREAVQACPGDRSEGDVLSALVDALPEDATLFVSNSMPVRDLDAYGGAGPKSILVLGNRGASGIDGIVSTVAGVTAGTAPRSVGATGPAGPTTPTAPPVVAVLGGPGVLP